MKRTIYENLKHYFPYIAEDAVRSREISMFDLIIELIDGTEVIYDDLEKTIRVLPRDCDNMTEEECRKEFGLRLRKLMFRKDISQNELSRRTGITQPMLNKYITGKVTPGFYAVDRICRALECSVEELRYVR